MKNIKVYEFCDLDKNTQDIIIERATNELVELEIEMLFNDDTLSEIELYNIIGCSKYYAESTRWFVPSVYYQKHKKEIDKKVLKAVNNHLYTANGRYIQNK